MVETIFGLDPSYKGFGICKIDLSGKKVTVDLISTEMADLGYRALYFAALRVVKPLDVKDAHVMMEIPKPPT